MSLKKIITNSILIFILCSLFHYLYDKIPCFFTSIIAPVNESIWEHFKMIFTSSIIFSLISNFYYKDNNLFIRGYLRGMLTIIILLIIYLPIRLIFGEIMIVSLLILLVSIFLSELITSKISLKKHIKYLNIISVILILINYILFTYLTYHPIKTFLFLDTKNNKYGIDILNK